MRLKLVDSYPIALKFMQSPCMNAKESVRQIASCNPNNKQTNHGKSPWKMSETPLLYAIQLVWGPNWRY